ncbi:MAG: hypothetical protein CL394_03605 [Acidiferrobacteraceae bacterium]|jgi:hypothetical protein|nr:hypothetical protein [Acidiferrobacteraceae bacterium]MDP7491045.1 DUF2779 domain-containing protein [Arenicellales bacterium]HJP45995.1 DUF2779 domain-containing protein [Arenicellales bacterium]
MTKPPYLTKSRYLDGLRCEKKLWLGCYERLPYAEAPPFSVLDTGERIGKGAWALFPGGVEVAEKPWEHAAAVASTGALMASDVPAIFEGAFEFDNVRIRVDVLERLDSGWGLREVKSSTSATEKKGHIDDVAVQLYVLQGCGLEVASVELIHVNSDYLLDESGIVWPEMLVRHDLSTEAHERLPQVARQLPGLFAVLAESAAPEVYATKSLCNNPYRCDYFDKCMAAKPEDWVGLLYRIYPNRLAALTAQGIESIPDIPEDFKLPEQQAHALDCLCSGQPWVAKELTAALKSFAPPAYYMDFETMVPGIPAYPDTRPFEHIPFQWSLHYSAEDGALLHKFFLAQGDNDPRREFAEKLIAGFERHDLPVVVYNQGYELRVLEALCGTFPDLADDLGVIVKNVVDLLPVVRNNVCHPGFISKRSLDAGTYSIKNVLPALVPGMSYSDLDGVAEGGEASRVFTAMVFGAYSGQEANTYRQQLLDYCERDTLAMVEIQRALEALAA